ncbi:Signal transduction histidine kinase [Auraticoccus monumenti]|uniref:Oxygen sensor histidine kinase NreB n=2 Tax=Auraticoccus monumenti TaxID=675864 RepID=A0A1G6RKF7_9ACTN|nr:Signal transduction histidine kinase [Auraticoccus monumenti]
MLVALGAFVLCGVGLALAQRHAALEEAVRDAEVTTTLLASRVVQPALPRTPLDPAEVDPAFDQVVRERVLAAPITQVRVLDEDGLVVYATDSSVVGQQEPLTPAQLDALRNGTTVATAVGDEGPDPTRLLGDREGQSLDVGVGVRSPSDQALLVQTRQPYEAVWLTSRTVWLSLLPSFVLALTLLYLAKIGFAYRLTRSLYGVQAEREQLLVTALAAADRERTLIASDLHDGVVQGLAGASWTLTDVANRTRSGGQPEVADTIAETARSLRQWVRELRSLIVTVTPPALHSEGLRATLTDLTATLDAREITVELDVQVSDTLSETTESLVYRVAQEAIRNVIRHAHASRVQLLVTQDDGWLRLTLTDDGQGFDATAVSARRRGSVGLTLLAALVQQRGGTLRVESAVGDGTTVTLVLPEQGAPDPDVTGGERARAGALR